MFIFMANGGHSNNTFFFDIIYYKGGVTMAKVFLSAGHGGKDPGATAYDLKEKDINLEILSACRPELERFGITVVCSRTVDEDDPVEDEVKEANKSKADIAVAFHTNSAKGDGSETYYYSKSKESRRLAELCEKYVQTIGQNSRGIKTGDGLYFIRKTTMPAVLCECAFIDNETDNKIIDTVEKRQAFGKAYAKAILEYLGIAFQEEGSDGGESGGADSGEVQPAKSFDKTLTGTYKTTTKDLKLRAGANSKYAELASMPKGAKVHNYGYYTKESDGTVWLYVVYDGIVGFASKGYLKKA